MRIVTGVWISHLGSVGSSFRGCFVPMYACQLMDPQTQPTSRLDLPSIDYLMVDNRQHPSRISQQAAVVLNELSSSAANTTPVA